MILALVVTALTVAAVGAPVGPAGASDEQPVDPHPERIVGGTQAPPGAWPSQAAILFHLEPDNYFAQYCGGTVLSATWVMTAAHCVLGDSPADVDVLTGTQNLASGGVRVRASQLKIVPGYDPFTERRDLALIRLARPVRARAMPYVEQGATVPAGTDLVTTGWGQTFLPSPDDFPTRLRQVHVPAVGDGPCQTAYGSRMFIDSMFCAGDMVDGGEDSCSGDSGGPISRLVSGTWVQVGLVSWGDDCALADKPGVYTRLAAFSNWVTDQTRLGPHRTAAAAARALFVDFYGRAPSSAELAGLTDLLADEPAWVAAAYLVAGAEWQGSAGDVARLYRAYFDRTGDTTGLRYWTGRIQRGASLASVSSTFAASSEFQSTYGDLDVEEYVELVYLNTLGRSADAAGLAFWTGRIEAGRLSRSGLMTMFARSSEFHRRTDAAVNVTITYLALVERVPTGTEIDRWSPLPNAELDEYLIDSYAYASRFTTK
jgi:hypothetical protein